MFDSPQTSTRASSRHQFDAAGLAVRERECKRTDGRLHTLISSAKSDDDWIKIADQIIAAHKVGNYKDPNGLRNNVLNRFLEDCTCGPAKRRYYDAVKPALAVVVRNHDEKSKPTRAQIEARRAANRAARHAAQPARGSSSGGGNNYGRQGKDKKEGKSKH